MCFLPSLECNEHVFGVFGHLRSAWFAELYSAGFGELCSACLADSVCLAVVLQRSLVVYIGHVPWNVIIILYPIVQYGLL